ncbi:MAG: class I SAM-dependent methyltransferase [Candidatus Omnitrophica bacterium]|nr:class I SAM-dependent methyltransferase [Candidatus Omnitrophota bacterium]
MKIRLDLPDPGILEKLNIPVLDKHTKLIYHPLTGILYQGRFRMALSCLADKQEKILEAGCGRGLFLPELSRRCSKLYTLDVHPRMDVVARMLKQNNTGNVYLNTGSVIEMPYKEKIFDTIVCISVLEHVTDLQKCFSEFFRVLKDSGELIIGFPAENMLTDFLFKLLKFDAAKFHPSGHRNIFSAAKKLFLQRELRVFPASFLRNFALYFVARFVKAGGKD